MHHHHHTLARLCFVALLASLSACDPPPVDEEPGRPRRGGDDEECRNDEDCRGGEVCDDDRCVDACVVTDSCGGEGEGEGEGEGPIGEGEGEGEGPVGEGEGEGEGEEPIDDGDVVITLEWNAGADDLDLHLSRTTPANWCGADDCHYGTETTTWGATLEADSLDGTTPERLRLAGAANGTYTLAVGSYKADTGAVQARVRVVVGSRVAYEDFRDLNEGEQWVPLTIRVDNGAVSTAVVNVVGAQPGACWGPNGAPVGTAGFGDSCRAGESCSDGLVCGLNTCAEVCITAADCEYCSASTGRACACTPLGGLGFCG